MNKIWLLLFLVGCGRARSTPAAASADRKITPAYDYLISVLPSFRDEHSRVELVQVSDANNFLFLSELLKNVPQKEWAQVSLEEKQLLSAYILDFKNALLFRCWRAEQQLKLKQSYEQTLARQYRLFFAERNSVSDRILAIDDMMTLDLPVSPDERSRHVRILNENDLTVRSERLAEIASKLKLYNQAD